MASATAARILRAPGRMVANPTDLGLAFPFGGVQVGLVRLAAAMPIGTPYVVQSEGLGAASDVLEAPERWVVSFFLRGWDDDAVQTLFQRNQSTGGVSGHQVFSVPGTTTPGASALARSVRLLYVPDSPREAPALLAYRAIPSWSDAAEMAFQRGAELGIPTVAECVRDEAGRALAIGRIADLTL